jgi:hypothetical protein
LKRFAVAAATVVVVLVAAGAAFAAVNNYKAAYTFSGKKGTKSKPVAVSFNQTITVTPATSGDRTGILHQITTKIAGVKVDASNAKKYTCTASTINTYENDTKCPKKALVATGAIKATLGAATDFTAPGQACDPDLHVWNGGHNKLIFFFVDQGSHQCEGGQIHTGLVPPWTAKYKQSGSNLVVTIPIPDTVDYPLGKSGGEVGSLSFEHLHWISQKQGSKFDLLSTGCKSAKRKYSFSFNASLPGQAAETKSTSGSAACH